MIVKLYKNENKMTTNNNKQNFEIITVPESRGLHDFVRWIDETNAKTIYGGITLKPPFQRKYTWSKEKASLLIDSFLRGLPTPSIFMYKDENGMRFVIDGQQRLETIYRFFKNEWAKDEKTGEVQKFTLSFADEENPYQGKTYETLDIKDKTALNDRLLMAVLIEVITHDPAQKMKAIHAIFERLNTGGVSLTSTDVRRCVNYKSILINKLDELSQNSLWNKIKYITRKKDRTDNTDAHEKTELILRIFAFYNKRDSYNSKMKTFLDDFCQYTTTDEYNQKSHTIIDEQKPQNSTNDDIKLFQMVLNDEKIINFIKPYFGKKNSVIECIFIACMILISQKKEYILPDNYDVFELDDSGGRKNVKNVFKQQGNTASKSVITKRINNVLDVLSGGK